MTLLLTLLLAQATSADIPQKAEAEAASEKKGRVCKTVRITGTRLKDRKVCMSTREWKEIEKEAQEAQRELGGQSKTGRSD